MTPKTDSWEGISWWDFAKVKKPPPLIENFLMEGTTQLCYGKFGTRKTTLHLLAAWNVSQGIPFLGMETQQRVVLYLDYENPATVLKAYCEDLKIDSSGPMFKIWDRSAGPPPKPGDKRLDRFIHNCKKGTGHRPWIIFDSWTSLLRVGASGKEVGDTTEIFRAIREYCDKGVTCTIIDHTGKRGGKDPIGSSAKMSQMDTAHLITIKTDKDITGKSSVSVVRVENFLKRFAPEGVGTFSMENEAARNGSGHWHTVSVRPTKDRSVRKTEKRISAMQHLISKNRAQGKEGLVKKAVEAGIESRDDARQLLEQGTGTYWKAINRGNNKRVFRVIKGESL
jgi:AAA domain